MWDWDHPCFVQWVVGIWGGSTRSSHRNAGHVASLLATQQRLLAAEVRNGDGQLHYVLRSSVYTRWSNLFYWRLGRVIASNILEPWYTLIIPVIMCLFLICWNPWWPQLKSRPMVAHHICCWNTPFILCVIVRRTLESFKPCCVFPRGEWTFERCCRSDDPSGTWPPGPAAIEAQSNNLSWVRCRWGTAGLLAWERGRV